jgi:hypothetical protein
MARRKLNCFNPSVQSATQRVGKDGCNPLFSLRENTIAKEPGLSYPE